MVGGAVEAQGLQVGDEVGDRALVDALTLAEDVELGWARGTLKVKSEGRCRKDLDWMLYISPAVNRHHNVHTTLSNISKSLALGWWMVQMMVRPPSARERIRETTW